jgi:hypothetical protein
MLDDARGQAAKLVSETEIIQQAQIQARPWSASPMKNAAAMSQEVCAYADNILHQLELNLEKAIFTIKKSREDLQGQKKHALIFSG